MFKEKDKDSHTGGGLLWSFIWEQRKNRRLALLGLFGMAVQFSVFKWCYPFPDFIPESYVYIRTAIQHLSIGVMPIGYSKFLWLLHLVTHLDFVLVAAQFLILMFAVFYFFFSFLNLFSPGGKSRMILFVFLFFNPLLLYLSNYISNDPLTSALTLVWFTQLFWVVSDPRPRRIVAQAILLLSCIVVDGAYYYLIVAVLGFCLAKSKFNYKLFGVLACLLAVLPFALYTLREAKRASGVAQLSLNRGWLLSNSALYARRHLIYDKVEAPLYLRALDSTVNDYFRQADLANIDNYLSGYATKFFIEDPASPLNQYLRTHVIDYYPDGPATWGNASAEFARYGNWIIRRYPISFTRYYLTLNACNYMLPPLESLESYNQGRDETMFEAQNWFDYPTPIVESIPARIEGGILCCIPYLFCVIQIFYLGGIVYYFIKRKLRFKKVPSDRLLLLAVFFIGFHFCNAIAGGPIVMRMQAVPFLVMTPFALLLLEYMEKKGVYVRETGQQLSSLDVKLKHELI